VLAVLAVLTVTGAGPAAAGPAPLDAPEGGAGTVPATGSGGPSWLTDVLPVGSAVLAMVTLLVVIAYLTGRHAGARVQPTA
jgi:hypothetical protein